MLAPGEISHSRSACRQEVIHTHCHTHTSDRNSDGRYCTKHVRERAHTHTLRELKPNQTKELTVNPEFKIWNQLLLLSLSLSLSFLSLSASLPSVCCEQAENCGTTAAASRWTTTRWTRWSDGILTRTRRFTQVNLLRVTFVNLHPPVLLFVAAAFITFSTSWCYDAAI